MSLSCTLISGVVFVSFEKRNEYLWKRKESFLVAHVTLKLLNTHTSFCPTSQFQIKTNGRNMSVAEKKFQSLFTKVCHSKMGCYDWCFYPTNPHTHYLHTYIHTETLWTRSIPVDNWILIKCRPLSRFIQMWPREYRLYDFIVLF